MPRIIDAFTQFFDDSGDPLADGYLKFVESGTNNTDKDTFADTNETIANANPLILDGAGRCPNVFGTGTYNVISYANDGSPYPGAPGAQIQQFDPVGGDVTEGAFVDWDSTTVYAEGDIVTASDGLYYRSLVAGNQNQDPTISPGQWEQVTINQIWNVNVTYGVDDPVYGSDGRLYVSRTSLNIGNDPIGDTTNWRPGVNEIDLKGADIATANDTVLLDDGSINDLTGSVTMNGLTTPTYGNPIRKFHLDGAPLLKHDTAPSVGFSKLFIVNGAADYQASAGDEFEAYWDGTYWRVFITKADGKAVVGTYLGPQLQAETPTTSGTSHDYTGIASTVSKITIMLDGVSTNGASVFLIQLGDSGGIETSGYVGTESQHNAASWTQTGLSTGFILNDITGAGVIMSGTIILTRYNSAGTTWMCSATLHRADGTNSNVIVSGQKTLTAALTQIRLTTAVGTDTFDAGSMNVILE